jgi:hypothetical protein
MKESKKSLKPTFKMSVSKLQLDGGMQKTAPTMLITQCSSLANQIIVLQCFPLTTTLYFLADPWWIYHLLTT